MKLVIVESPAKAKTINKYLGKDFAVEASFGHIRDLPSKSGSVLPDEDFSMKYEISDKSTKYISKITTQAKKAEEIYLATDPDREGESISWHIMEVLKQKKIAKSDEIFKRVAFNEITKKAVLDAVANPRSIDLDLVNAQQARRALDYLVGFTLSPILWRKLPGCRSAGRVQSVALRLICEREDEIERFIPREYWDIAIDLLKDGASKSQTFTAKLSHIEGKKLDKFAISNEQQAKAIELEIKQQEFSVLSVENKQQRRNPSAPFITSSLQQEASRKLGFGAKRTMQVAQKLYEGIELSGEVVGLITYMRTDGVTLSADAIKDARQLIEKDFGSDYLPEKARVYKSKAKNAQEAHEAIRPTDLKRKPKDVAKFLSPEQLKLYDLIWKRTVASQMANVIIDTVVVQAESQNHKFISRATGSRIKFDGFYKVYKEGNDDDKEEKNNNLPPLEQGDKLNLQKVLPNQHFTEAPPRYSEASLVKKLEELGIGRPSTYASIISVLQERKYATIDKKRFHPSELGRLVTTFLVGFFKKYVEYDFTADLEANLDKIADGNKPWKELLTEFWQGFNANISDVSEQKIGDVISYVEQQLDFHLFGSSEDEGYNKRKSCSVCADGKLNLKLGKFGAFLACSNYPDCTFKKTISQADGSEASDDIAAEDNNKILGNHPSGKEVSLKKGPYGWYVELPADEAPIDSAGKKASKNKKPKPKRIALFPGMVPSEVTLETALKLLELPLYVCMHNDTGEKIVMNIGRFGPYLKHKDKFISIPKKHDPFAVSSDLAHELIRLKEEKDKAKQAKK